MLCSFIILFNFHTFSVLLLQMLLNVELILLISVQAWSTFRNLCDQYCRSIKKLIIEMFDIYGSITCSIV